MKTVYLVTGNPQKLAEWKRMFAGNAAFTLESADIDLPEIQSLDLVEIIKDKARKAYEATNAPVIVEDVSAELDELNRLPGPFIKYFEEALGSDALYKLCRRQNSPATIVVTLAYYDGSEFVIADGRARGTVVESRGDGGFGFDHCFIPNGQTKTYAEMTPAEKDSLSHRSIAMKDLIAKLTS